MSHRVAQGLSALALAGLSSFALVGTAHAEGDCGDVYPPPATCLPATANKTTVGAGGTVSGSFQPVEPNSSGPIQLYSTPQTLGTYQANAAGVVNYTVTIPKSTPAGAHTLAFPATAPGGVPVTFTVDINVTAAGTGNGLPLTGGQIGAASVLAVGLVGGGTLAVIASRRRKEKVLVPA
jgi:LPXTG-motif cell wall-anchored protein